MDGIVPANMTQQYTLLLLASPIRDVGERKLRLGEIYSGLAPYASWQTNYTFTESDSQMSGATVGLNVGASAGMQAGTNQSMTDADATSDSTNSTESENSSVGKTSGTTHSESSSSTHTDTSSESTTGSVQVSTTMGAQAGVGAGGVGVGVEESVSVGASVSRGYTGLRVRSQSHGPPHRRCRTRAYMSSSIGPGSADAVPARSRAAVLSPAARRALDSSELSMIRSGSQIFYHD